MRRFSLVLALAAVTAAVAVSPAAADPPPDPTTPTLTGETLQSLTGVVSGACNADRNGTFGYKVSGIATGPYPGTFEEQGTIAFRSNVVVGFKAVFRITSEVGSVRGTKVFIRTSRPSLNRCAGPTLTVTDVVLRYNAEIITPLGIFSDTGISRASFTYTGLTVSLTETFVSTLETPVIVLDPPGLSPPILPGHGCGDENHIHEDAELCALPDAIDEPPAE